MAGRRSAIQEIAEALVTMDEREVDSILRAAGARAVTPEGWASRPLISRRVIVTSLLQDFSEKTIENLVLSVPVKVGTALPLPESRTSTGGLSQGQASSAASIFVVHGHARGELYETVRVLERITNLDVIVLHEQANTGRTILQKFEDYASDVSYAVVLLTPDDMGRAISDPELKHRARQNVIFELGFFFAKLGRQNVAVLRSEDVEKPSDIDGLVYITLDASGGWKLALARELRAAEIPIDYGKIP